MSDAKEGSTKPNKYAWKQESHLIEMLSSFSTLDIKANNNITKRHAQQIKSEKRGE